MPMRRIKHRCASWLKSGLSKLLDKVSDKDRREIETTMHKDVLESSRFPEMIFEASNPSISKGGEDLYWVNLQGKLTLHGVTKPQQITARVSFSGSEMRASGEFTVRQTNFGIKLVSVAGGTLKLKDDVKLTFELVGHKQESPPPPGRKDRNMVSGHSRANSGTHS